MHRITMLNWSGVTYQYVLYAIVTLYTTVPSYCQESISWQNITTVEDVCLTYPDRVASLLAALNLNHPDLQDVRQAFEKKDLVVAGTTLLQYYENSNNALHLRKETPPVGNRSVADADTILNNVFSVQNVRGQLPIGTDGHRDWYYKGPNNDREWAWLSNRHSQINYLLSVYFDTGNPKYAKYIDLFIRDFIIKSFPYPAVKSSTSVWRGLEVAARAKVWSRIFYGLLNNPLLTPSTRLLMLSSLVDHAHYNRNFHGKNNWLTMEISALATIAANFPEFNNSEKWLNYCIETMIESMQDQTYPDGVQTELTSHYHNVSLRNFELFKDICDRAGKSLPDYYNSTIESMYEFIAHAIRPDGYRILNNDGDRGSDRDMVIKGAEKFDREDWKYIATNGVSGARPQDGPSWFYPWAGQLISRSGYDTDAHWSFFDVGPWGSGHQHNDKMHLSISAYGRDLLVDAGRFAYTGEVARKFRGYAKSTQGHNSLLIDGKGQKPDIRLIENPLSPSHYKITPEFDFAWNSFDKYHDLENVKHSRSLMYVRNHFWIVVDKVDTDQPRKIETMWHWHPKCDIQVNDKKVVASNNEHGNLQIIPVNEKNWDIKFVKGQEDPEIQGWYSVEYNKFEPNSVSIYSSTIESNKTFVWLILPFQSEIPEIEILDYSLAEHGVNLTISNALKAVWDIFIPYSDSQFADVDFH